MAHYISPKSLRRTMSSMLKPPLNRKRSCGGKVVSSVPRKLKFSPDDEENGKRHGSHPGSLVPTKFPFASDELDKTKTEFSHLYSSLPQKFDFSPGYQEDPKRHCSHPGSSVPKELQFPVDDQENTERQSSPSQTSRNTQTLRNDSDVQSKFDPQINFDFVPECCQPEPSERAQTCAVEGSRFCLGSLSVADHCSEFGGGPGVDRQDGPTGPIIFCGVGTRYKRPPVEVVEPDAVETEQPEAVGAPLPIISDSTLPDTVKFGASIYFHIILKLKLVNCALGSVLAALKTVEAPMLPFVTAAGDRFTDIYEKFSDSKPSLAVQYLDTEKAFPVFDFDAKDFIGCLKLPIGEDVDAILKMLTEFTSLVEHLYACFADHDYININ